MAEAARDLEFFSSPLSKWLDLLECPEDGGNLLAGHDDLICQNCRKRYPFKDGILSFLSEEFDDSRKFDEMKSRDELAKGYDSMFANIVNRVELPPYLKAIGENKNHDIVELGCGTGRVTSLYANHARRTVAIDFSQASLRVLARKLLHPENVLLIQADVCRPPLKKGSFHRVLSFQVLEHIPTPSLRQKAVSAAAALCQSNGRVIFSVYNWAWRKQKDFEKGREKVSKEGVHPSGSATQKNGGNMEGMRIQNEHCFSLLPFQKGSS